MTFTHTAVLELRETKYERPETLVGLLRERAAADPDAPLYEYLADGEDDIRALTVGELDRNARHVGAILQALGAQGSRAIVLFPPGVEFVTAFFGCLYAGVIAVPTPPPEDDEAFACLENAVRDAGARFILTAAEERKAVAARLSGRGVSVLAPQAAAHDCSGDWSHPMIDPGSLAYLQYTPGGPGSTRGVMLSHVNLLHNLELTGNALALTADDRLMSWQAPYHEMGLVAGILQPLHVGCKAVLMTPEHFLQRPYRWLRAISQHGVTVTGGPNFAYDLCVRNVTPAERQGLDLSGWRVALNGTEPVLPRTLAGFGRTFAPHGFDCAAFYPFYGTAEATFLVSGGSRPTTPAIELFEPSELDAGTARIVAAPVGRRLASCGTPRPGQIVRIVDPESLQACGSGTIGEIWIGGPSISQGFWRRRAETMDAFGAFIRDTGEGPFLRTGDLGFLLGGELFFTGRLADRIAVGGRRYLLHEVEDVAGASHEALSPGGGVAFTVPSGGADALVVLHEMRDITLAANGEEIAKIIRTTITGVLGLDTRDVVLVRPGYLPRGATGRPARRVCRRRYLAGSLRRSC